MNISGTRPEESFFEVDKKVINKLTKEIIETIEKSDTEIPMQSSEDFI